MAKTTVDYQKIFRQIDKINGGMASAVKDGLDIALRENVDYIKVEYSRPTTGKGFTDRTANLRNSIGQDSQLTHRGAMGIVNAKMEYAPYVETINEGQYAFLWPGVNDMGDNYLKRIGEAVKRLL